MVRSLKKMTGTGWLAALLLTDRKSVV